MVELSRRQFVAAAAAGVAAGAAPAIRASQANKTYRTALIGSGWWGMNVLREALSSGACQAVALCDVDADRLELAAEEIGELQSGTPKTYGDFRELLDRPDIDDMFVFPYRPGPSDAPPGHNEDPGRIRYEPLFIKMYGDCEAGEVGPKLRDVAWLKGRVRLTTANGAADALEAVVADLRNLPPELTKYLVPSAGTYNCRRIAGTDRRSMHAYGAAIDINTKYADYWMWAKPVDGAYPYRNRIPDAIVAAFERHGFVWGGKWYHYDTMHFEYRPELLPGPAG